MIEISKTEIQSLPPSTRTHTSSRPFAFEEFEENIYRPFLDRFVDEVKEAFNQLDFCLGFVVFDPRKLPQKKDALNNYGITEIEELLSHYGRHQSDECKNEVSKQTADIDGEKVLIEWGDFKPYLDRVILVLVRTGGGGLMK